ncbi:tyrosine-protein phosphatase, partial [Lutimonas sp.]|uniref:metallophosphoesterase family protein n=1 Tax=Lutimonas sp. TaxID=1872403 RepID=UPI003D9B9D3E
MKTNKKIQPQRLFESHKFCGLSLVILALFLLSFYMGKAQEKHFKGDQESKAYTNLNFNQDKNSFRFAIIGDRTGGHRNEIFPAAIDMLNLLQPEFVINVGDLIEGYVEDEAVLKSMWQEVDETLTSLEMPFFLVAGNHDINLDPSEKVWFDRVGTDRSYSHFVYKNVLFLQLSTEDPPKNDPGEELEEKYDRVKAGQVSPEEGRAIVEELEAWAGKVNISQQQVDYFSKVLKDNPKVRWTFAFMHTPAWTQPDLGNFAKIEALLANRPYTVFAGHTHTYDYTQRKGRDYITMGMTGGLSPELATKGNMDHITLVTMNHTEPVISNLLMNGILDKRGALPSMQDYLLYQPRQLTRTSFSLAIKTVPNLRDLGGQYTDEGAVMANGLLYRSNQLSGITPEDMKKIADLGLVNAFDLRT